MARRMLAARTGDTARALCIANKRGLIPKLRNHVAKNDKMEIEHPVGIHQDYFLTEHIPNWIGAQ
jgi:hypothetical protein